MEELLGNLGVSLRKLRVVESPVGRVVWQVDLMGDMSELLSKLGQFFGELGE